MSLKPSFLTNSPAQPLITRSVSRARALERCAPADTGEVPQATNSTGFSRYQNERSRDTSTDLPTQRSQEGLDILHPLFDIQMLELFPKGELPDLSDFETNQLSLDCFIMDS